MVGFGWIVTIMGRGTRLRGDNNNKIIRIKDDRRVAQKIDKPKQFDMFLDRGGAVATAIYEEGGYPNQIVKYGADGVRTVNNDNVQKAVTSLREEIINARFEPKERIDKLRDEESLTDETGKPLTSKQKENLEARQYQVRAIALLTAIRVGKTKVAPYDKGILNRLAKGEYYDVVYGAKDSRGQRQFEKGTFKSKLDFRQGNTQSSTAEGRARAKELADRLREANNVALSRGRSKTGHSGYKGFYDSIKAS